MNKEVRKAQEIQDEVFRKMTAEQKIKMVGQLFKLGKKFQKFNPMADQELSDYINTLIKKFGLFETLNRLKK